MVFFAFEFIDRTKTMLRCTTWALSSTLKQPMTRRRLSSTSLPMCDRRRAKEVEVEDLSKAEAQHETVAVTGATDPTFKTGRLDNRTDPLPEGRPGASNPQQSQHSAAIRDSTRKQPNTRRRLSPPTTDYAAVTDNVVSAGSNYDKLTTLIVNSKTKELHLNQSQQDAIFAARSQFYRQSLKQIVTVLQGHLSPIEKCHRLLLLHDSVVIRNRLRLRADTYEEIFHHFYATATSGVFHVDNMAVGSSMGGVASSSSSHAVYEAHDAASAANRDIHTYASPFLGPIWTMYRYMIDSGTDPNHRIVQHVMGLLGRVQRRHIDVEARAHALMMDCDRLKLSPTPYTLVDYCRICTVNQAMHLAMARVTDSMTRHEMPPDADVSATLLRGLTVNKHHKEALKLLTTLHNVPLTLPLLHAALQAGRYSGDPTSALALYESVRGSGVRPTAFTIGILIGVIRDLCMAAGSSSGGSRPKNHSTTTTPSKELQGHVLMVLREMLRYRVQMPHRLLNHMLECLVVVGQRKAFVSLARAMIRRLGERSVFAEKYPQEWVYSSGMKDPMSKHLVPV